MSDISQSCIECERLARENEWLRKELAYIAIPLNESEPQIYFAAQSAAEALGGLDEARAALDE